MNVYDLFSKRQKILRGEMPDVYSYDTIPQTLKAQIVHIWGDVLGGGNEYVRSPKPQSAYKFIVDLLCREYGVFSLREPIDQRERDYRLELIGFILMESEHERILDAVEVSFRFADKNTRDVGYLGRYTASADVDSAYYGV